MPSDNTRTVPELMGAAISEVTGLFRKEVQLARAEMGEKLGQVSGGVAPLVAGGAVMLAALVVALLAAVSLLVTLGLRPGLAQLLVAVVFAGLGYLLVKGGLDRMRVANLVPTRTAEQLSRDAQVMKEQVR